MAISGPRGEAWYAYSFALYLYCPSTFGPEIRPPLTGEARRIKEIREILALWFRPLPFAYQRRAQRRANNISCRLFTLHQNHWNYVASTALPIIPELAYKHGGTDQKRKF